MDKIKFEKNAHNNLWPRHVVVLIWVVVIAGIVIRIIRLMDGRSLWLDEVMLADNIMSRSYLELIKPLHSHQSAPLFFLWFEKIILNLFGFGEKIIRLPSFLASVLCLPLMYKLLKQFVCAKVTLFGITLFALLPSVLYYSAEVKQYTFDILFTLILTLQALSLSRKYSPLKMLALAITGSFAVWIFHSSVFVEAGLGSVLIVQSFLKRRIKVGMLYVLVAIIWFLSFGVNFLFILSEQTADGVLQAWWIKAFLPLIPKSLEDCGILAYHFFHFFCSPFFTWHELPHRMIMPASSTLVAFACFVGVGRIYNRWREGLFIIVTPILFTIVASGMKWYPFRERFLLFLVPAILVLLCAGIEQVVESFGKSLRIAALSMPALLLLLVLIGAPMIFVRPNGYEDVRPALEYIAENMEPGDTVYIHNRLSPQFNFYTKYVKSCQLTKPTLLYGAILTDGLAGLHNDLEALKQHDRVWYLYGPPWERKDTEGGLVGAGLGRTLNIIDRKQWEKTEVHLYLQREE